MIRCTSFMTIITAAVLLLPAEIWAQSDTIFNYQGQLNENGLPVTDVCDFRFRLYVLDIMGPQDQLPRRTI